MLKDYLLKSIIISIGDIDNVCLVDLNGLIFLTHIALRQPGNLETGIV